MKMNDMFWSIMKLVLCLNIFLMKYLSKAYNNVVNLKRNVSNENLYILTITILILSLKFTLDALSNENAVKIFNNLEMTYFGKRPEMFFFVLF